MLMQINNLFVYASLSHLESNLYNFSWGQSNLDFLSGPTIKEIKLKRSTMKTISALDYSLICFSSFFSNQHTAVLQPQFLSNLPYFVYRYAGAPVLGSQYLGAPLPRPPLFSAPLYTSSPPFHSLLAGLAAPPRQSPDPPPVSPPISPGSESPPTQPTAPEIERRSSSIAALRMAAREHELRLEILRQRHHTDLIS